MIPFILNTKRVVVEMVTAETIPDVLVICTDLMDRGKDIMSVTLEYHPSEGNVWHIFYYQKDTDDNANEDCRIKCTCGRNRDSRNKKPITTIIFKNEDSKS